MPDNKDIQKIAIEDARARQSALIQLIYFTDQQAFALLRLYVTVAIAAAAAGVSTLSTSQNHTASVSLSLFSAVFCLAVGCYFSFRSMQSAEINLPGRGADFWLDALHESRHEFQEVVDEYLKQLNDGQIRDRNTNKRAAINLNKAKLAGAVAPLFAIAVGISAEAYRTFFG